MKLSNDNVFKRDESKMHSVPLSFPYLLMTMIVISIVSGIIVVVNIVSSRITETTIVLIILLAVILLFGVFCDNYFNWYENVRYELGNEIIYRYDLNGIMLPSNNHTVSVTLKEVKNYKISGKKIKLTGKFVIKRPVAKPKTANRVTLQIDLEDKEKVLTAINKLKKGI